VTMQSRVVDRKLKLKVGAEDHPHMSTSAIMYDTVGTPRFILTIINRDRNWFLKPIHIVRFQFSIDSADVG
jgi:hypothetical protein